MKRRKRIKRNKRPNATSKTRGPAPGRDDALRDFVRSQGCLVRGHHLHVRCALAIFAHVKPWGSSRVDWNNGVPLCVFAHAEQEGKTRAFEKKYGVDLKKEAVRLTLAFAQRQQPQA